MNSTRAPLAVNLHEKSIQYSKAKFARSVYLFEMCWLLGAWSHSFDFIEAMKYCNNNNNDNNNEAFFYLCIYSDRERDTYPGFKESFVSGFEHSDCVSLNIWVQINGEKIVCKLQTFLGLLCCLQPDAVWCCLGKPGQTIITGLNTKYLQGAFFLSDSTLLAEFIHFIAYITVVSNRLIYNTWSFT